MKKNFCLLISYDGTEYLGWQKTAHGKSVEEELEKALCRILQTPLTLQAASRTDKGVHAVGQVVNFLLPASSSPPTPNELLYRTNQLLPEDIRVHNAQQVPTNFHPTLDSLHKEYRYYIETTPVSNPMKSRFSWHCPKKLDLDQLKEAAKMFIGVHNFAAFTNRQNGVLPNDCTREMIQIEIIEKKNSLIFSLKGKSFLYKMARNITGTLIDIGRKKLFLKDLEKALQYPDRKNTGITAPAKGLHLFTVAYSSPVFPTTKQPNS